MPGGEPGNDRYTSSHLVSLESPRPPWLRRRGCMATAMKASLRSTMATPITPPTLDSGPSSIHCRVDARWLQARKELGETPRPTSWSVALPRHCVQLLPLQHCWLAACTGPHSASRQLQLQHCASACSGTYLPKLIDYSTLLHLPRLLVEVSNGVLSRRRSRSFLIHRNVIDTLSWIRPPRPRGLVY